MAVQLFSVRVRWIAARPYRQPISVELRLLFSFPPLHIDTSVNANNRFRTRLLKRIDTWSAFGPEEKKIRIYRRIMFHRTTLFRLYARDGAALFTLATVFVNTSRVCTQSTAPRLVIS